MLKDALAKKYVPETERKEVFRRIGGRDDSRSSPRRKEKKDHRILGLQNESVLRETNSGAGWLEREPFTQKRKPLRYGGRE